ncbi:hypothetical protein D050_4770B, partial [Vibrio parahaemolyticus VPCR-2009]
VPVSSSQNGACHLEYIYISAIFQCHYPLSSLVLNTSL